MLAFLLKSKNKKYLILLISSIMRTNIQLLLILFPLFSIAQTTTQQMDNTHFVSDSAEITYTNIFQKDLDENKRAIEQRKKDYEKYQAEHDSIDRIVNPEKYKPHKKPESPIERILVTTVAAAIVGGITYLIRRDRERKNSNNEDDHQNEE